MRIKASAMLKIEVQLGVLPCRRSIVEGLAVFVSRTPHLSFQQEMELCHLHIPLTAHVRNQRETKQNLRRVAACENHGWLPTVILVCPVLICCGVYLPG